MAESPDIKKPEAKRVEVDKSTESKKDEAFSVTASCPPEFHKPVVLNPQAQIFLPNKNASFNKEAKPFVPKTAIATPSNTIQGQPILPYPAYVQNQYPQAYPYGYGTSGTYVPPSVYQPPTSFTQHTSNIKLSSVAPPFFPGKKMDATSPSIKSPSAAKKEELTTPDSKSTNVTNNITPVNATPVNTNKEIKQEETPKEKQVLSNNAPITGQEKIITNEKKTEEKKDEKVIILVTPEATHETETKKTAEPLWKCKIVDKKFPIEFIQKLAQMKEFVTQLSKNKSYNSASLEEAQMQSPNKNKSGNNAGPSPTQITKKIQSEEEKRMYEAVNKGKKALGPNNQTQKDINLLLNQLTPDNFATKLNRLCDILNQENEKMKTFDLKKHANELIGDNTGNAKMEDAPNDHIYFMQYLFRKAEKEKKYKKIYGKLCNEILKKAQNSNNAVYKDSFNIILMRASQNRFEELTQEMKRLFWSEDTSDIHQERKVKCRDIFFGSIRFLGELFSLNLLNTNIITNYMLMTLIDTQDLKNKDLERDYKIASVELLDVMGERLDERLIKKSPNKGSDKKHNSSEKKSHGKTATKLINESPKDVGKKSQLLQNIQHIYDEIESIAKSVGGYDSTLVYKSKNLLERRRNNWVATRMNKDDPKTLKEVHEELDDEEYYPVEDRKRENYHQSYSPSKTYSPKIEKPEIKEKTSADIAFEVFNAYLENKTLDLPKDISEPKAFLKEIHSLIENAKLEVLPKIENTFGEFYTYLATQWAAKDIVIDEMIEFIYNIYPDALYDAPYLYKVYSNIISSLIINKTLFPQHFYTKEIAEDHVSTLILLLNAISLSLSTEIIAIKLLINIVINTNPTVIDALKNEKEFETVSPKIKSLIFVLMILFNLKCNDDCEKATEIMTPICKENNFDGPLIYFLVVFINKMQSYNYEAKLGSKILERSHHHEFVIQSIITTDYSLEEASKLLGDWLDDKDLDLFQRYNQIMLLLKSYNIQPKKKLLSSPSK